MSTIGEVGASSFDSYEGIRIVLPGIIAVASGQATFTAVAPGARESLTGQTLISLVASLVAGLVLYYWDIPARSAAYTEGQPTDYLEAKYPSVSPAVLVTAYLNVLNTVMPANLRNRALYMGSMYRIGVEMILALSLASSVVMAASLLDYGEPSGTEDHRGRILSGTTLILTFLVGIAINRGYERKSAARRREDVRNVFKLMVRDLTRGSMLVYVLGLLALLVPNLTLISNRISVLSGRLCCISGISICMSYWILRYVRGDKEGESRKRRRIEAISSGALYMTPLALSLLIYRPLDSTILHSSSKLFVWTAVVSITLISIMVRGHERKLHGSYSGQRRWLQDNPEAYSELITGRATAA